MYGARIYGVEGGVRSEVMRGMVLKEREDRSKVLPVERYKM